jgi:hypothetical protein
VPELRRKSRHLQLITPSGASSSDRARNLELHTAYSSQATDGAMTRVGFVCISPLNGVEDEEVSQVTTILLHCTRVRTGGVRSPSPIDRARPVDRARSREPT